MSQGKYLSLEEARKLGRLDQFAKNHPSTGIKQSFDDLLDAMAHGGKPDSQIKKMPAAHRTSDPGPLPAVVAILKFLHVILKVLLGNVNVGPSDRQLQPRPKPLDPVNVAISVNIFASAVVHRLMLETGLGQPAVGLQFVAVHRATLFDVSFDDRLKCFLLNVWDNLCHHVAAAFQHPEHNSLVGGAATALTSRPLAPNIGFRLLR